MRAWRRERFWPVLVLSILLPACSSNNDTGSPTAPTTVDDPTISDALDGYWTAQEGFSGRLADMDRIWDRIPQGMGKKAATDAEVSAAVADYVAATASVAAELDTLIELEAAIVPYGAGKGAFTVSARSTVQRVYEAGRGAVVSSGQMLHTCWQVLSGSQTVRDALGASDAGVAVISAMTGRLQERIVARDAAVIETILGDDTRDGFVPLTQLAGATPEEKAESYRNLTAEDPLKLQIRGSVHLWHEDERLATIDVLEIAARDQIRFFAGAAAGSAPLVEAGDQLRDQGQAAEDGAPVTVTLRDDTTGGSLADRAVVFLSKRDQPEGLARIAVLDGADANFTLQAPTGAYDLVVVAPNHIRGVAEDYDVMGGVAENLAFDLIERQGNSVILETITAEPAIAAPDDVVRLSATAVSTVGRNLQFVWEATGPGEASVWGQNEEVRFVADTPGDYAVTLTVTDDQGGSKELSTTIRVLGTAVSIAGMSVDDGAFTDSYVNPGETFDVFILLENPSETLVNVTANLAAHGTAQVTAGAAEEFSLAAGAQRTWQVTIALPANYSRDKATFTATLATAENVIERVIELPVRFYVDFDRINSPVTDRVLNVVGRVANPSLSTAYLILDDDIDQVWPVHLTNGQFAQAIILEGSDALQTSDLELVADSGGWRETKRTSFSTSIQPAIFRVTLTWDTPETDVDLWVTDPSGEKCYYANPVTASGLDLDVDDVTGFGPENITNLDPPPGEYLVQVHYFSDHDGTTAIGSNCQIAIRLFEGTANEQIRHYTGFLGDSGDLWTVTTLELGDKSMPRFTDTDAHGHVAPADLPAKR